MNKYEWIAENPKVNGPTQFVLHYRTWYAIVIYTEAPGCDEWVAQCWNRCNPRSPCIYGDGSGYLTAHDAMLACERWIFEFSD